MHGVIGFISSYCCSVSDPEVLRWLVSQKNVDVIHILSMPMARLRRVSVPVAKTAAEWSSEARSYVRMEGMTSRGV